MTKKHHLTNTNILDTNILDNEKQEANPRAALDAFLYNHVQSIQDKEKDVQRENERVQRLQYIKDIPNTYIESEISTNSNKDNSEERGCLEITSEITSEIQFDIF